MISRRTGTIRRRLRIAFPETIKVLKVRKLDQLLRILADYRIPTRLWGKKLAHTPEQLLQELLTGKCRLVAWEGRLVRMVSMVSVFLYRPLTDDVWQHLIETKRSLPNKAMKPYRELQGVSKKVKNGETAEEAARRIFTEELREACVSEIPRLYEASSDTKRVFDSRSYPGIIAERNHRIFLALAPENLIQNKKRAFFYTKENGMKIRLEWAPILREYVDRVILEAAEKMKKK